MQIFITGIDGSIMMHHWRLLANMSEPSMRGSQGWAVQKQLNWSRCHLGEHSCGPDKLCIRWGCTLTLPGEYDWTFSCTT